MAHVASAQWSDKTRCLGGELGGLTFRKKHVSQMAFKKQGTKVYKHRFVPVCAGKGTMYRRVMFIWVRSQSALKLSRMSFFFFFSSTSNMCVCIICTTGSGRVTASESPL